MIVTEKMLQQEVAELNELMGYGAGPRYVRLKSGRGKSMGKGFLIDYSYGGVRLNYANFGVSTGQRDVSPLRQTKFELYYALRMMTSALLIKKRKK